jgi:hypothetical protein
MESKILIKAHVLKHAWNDYLSHNISATTDDFLKDMGLRYIAYTYRWDMMVEIIDVKRFTLAKIRYGF